MKEKKNTSSRIVGVISIVLIVLIAIFVIILTNGKEIHVWDDSEPKKVSAVVCSAGNIEGAFFASNSANTVENEIKITFSDNKLDKLFYSYNGVYRSEDMVERDETAMHAKYNIYMGNHDVAQDSLAPSYSMVGTKLQITLYADKPDKINDITAPLFFMNLDGAKDLENYSRETMKNYYEKQGFSCKNVD